ESPPARSSRGTPGCETPLWLRRQHFDFAIHNTALDWVRGRQPIVKVEMCRSHGLPFDGEVLVGLPGRDGDGGSDDFNEVRRIRPDTYVHVFPFGLGTADEHPSVGVRHRHPNRWRTV